MSITPPIASLPYSSEEGPFRTLTVPILKASSSSPWSAPHCCPSCLIPFSSTAIRLNPIPRIIGLEKPEPISIACTPGMFSIACMKFPVKCLRRKS